MHFFVFFGCFRAYVGQPHCHIRWTTSMPFASCNPTKLRTNLWNFHEKISRIGDFEKWPFFESAILIFFFKKKNCFCFIPMKISHKLCITLNGTQLLWLCWFTAQNHSPQTYQPAVYGTTVPPSPDFRHSTIPDIYLIDDIFLIAVLYVCFRLLLLFLNFQAQLWNIFFLYLEYFPFSDWNIFLFLIGIFSFSLIGLYYLF